METGWGCHTVLFFRLIINSLIPGLSLWRICRERAQCFCRQGGAAVKASSDSQPLISPHEGTLCGERHTFAKSGLGAVIVQLLLCRRRLLEMFFLFLFFFSSPVELIHVWTTVHLVLWMKTFTSSSKIFSSVQLPQSGWRPEDKVVVAGPSRWPRPDPRVGCSMVSLVMWQWHSHSHVFLLVRWLYSQQNESDTNSAGQKPMDRLTEKDRRQTTDYLNERSCSIWLELQCVKVMWFLVFLF